MTMNNSEREIQFLGAYVHGVLTAFHALGVLYNVRRQNWLDVGIHALFMVYDADSTRRHLRRSEDE